MATFDLGFDSPVIKSLGSHFKLTEVFLWDDGCSTDVQLFPKHTRFKYDGDDNDDDVIAAKSNSNSSLDTIEDSTLTEDVELTKQMSALGLPLSFQTSKQVSGKTKTKNKVTKLKNQHNQKKSEDKVQGFSIMVEDSSCIAVSQDKSNNSSSSSLPDQTEYCSGCVDLPAFDDLYVELGAELACEFVEDHLHDSTLCIVENCENSEHNEKDVYRSLSEQVDSLSPESYKNVMQTEDLGSSTIVEPIAHSSDNDDIGCSSSSGDWSPFWDSDYMRYFFYNAKTHESTWDPPPGMDNFAFGDYSCASNESKAELNDLDEEVARLGNKQVDGCVMVSETGSDEQTKGDIGSDVHCHILRKETAEVNCSDLSNQPDLFVHHCGNSGRHIDDNIIVESSSASSSTSVVKAACNDDDIDQTYVAKSETIPDESEMQDTPVSTKRKKKRKTRRRKKSSNDNSNNGNDLQLVQDFHIDITKYWHQRYLLFSKFDHGIKMDEEGWFSVTPEALARHHASRSGGGIVIDCFAGVGGNAIQFAKVSKQVIAIDIDSRKIDYAYDNAVIYGVEDKIEFVRGDSLSLAQKLIADTVFLSPPWGGPDYVKMDSYDINMLLPFDGHLLFNTFEAICSKIIMFLPRNVNVIQLAELSLTSNTRWSLEVEKNFLNGKLKAVTAYYNKILE